MIKSRFMYLQDRGFFWRFAFVVARGVKREAFVGPFATLDEAWTACCR